GGGAGGARGHGPGWRLPGFLRPRALRVGRRALRPLGALPPVAAGALLGCIGVEFGTRVLVLLERALALDERPEVLLERELPVARVLQAGHAGEVDRWRPPVGGCAP